MSHQVAQNKARTVDACFATKRRRGTISVVTCCVAPALNRTKKQQQEDSHNLSALAASNQYAEPAGELIISPSAIHRAKKDNSAALAAVIRESFDPKVPPTIHWDGKIMLDVTVTRRGYVDRHRIMASGKDVTKLLTIPKLQSSTAPDMANACLAAIRN